MALYVYRDADDNEFVAEYPIGTAPRTIKRRKDGMVAKLVIGAPYIAAAATPSKRHGVRAAAREDRRRERDLPAYAALRKKGLQPRSTIGAADLAERVDDQFDIDYAGALAHGSRSQVEDTIATVADWQTLAREGVA